MARGYTTIRIPQIPLSREEIAVHSAAHAALAYFRQHIGNRHVSPDAPLLRPPLLEFVSVGDERLLVRGFDQLALLPETNKIECLVWDRGELDDEAICVDAWLHVIAFEPLRLIGAPAIAARFQALMEHFPERLIELTLAADPKRAEGTALTTESLCRACGVSSDSVRGYMPMARSGGIATHSYTNNIVREEPKK